MYKCVCGSDVSIIKTKFGYWDVQCNKCWEPSNVSDYQFHPFGYKTAIESAYKEFLDVTEQILEFFEQHKHSPDVNATWKCADRYVHDSPLSLEELEEKDLYPPLIKIPKEIEPKYSVAELRTYYGIDKKTDETVTWSTCTNPNT